MFPTVFPMSTTHQDTSPRLALPEDELVRVGARIELLRNTLPYRRPGMGTPSQEDLATKVLGVSRSHLANCLAGRKRFTVKQVQDLAAALHADPELITGQARRVYVNPLDGLAVAS